MSRRGNNAQNSNTETLEAPEVTTDEVTPEATPEPASEATPEKAPKAEETPADLGPFKTVAEAAVLEMDESTGELPTAVVASVNEAYRAIDGVKGKNQARAWVETEMVAAIIAKNIQLARAYVVLKDNLSAGSSSAAPKAPADPTSAFVQKVSALQIALSLTSENVPEGVTEDWAEKADTLVAELGPQVTAFVEWNNSDDEDAEQPEVHPVVRQAFKLSQGKTPGGSGRVSGGPRRDIEKHLQQVFSPLSVGDFLTVSEIAKAKSEEYGDDAPSAGAVSARLFPKGKDAYDAGGIKATSSEEGKARGATKVA